ncbi:DUF4382 domain-containing protein [Winogradskyella sp. 4-2091]|uniref:DUF4382 domain-containing protein n=1 Tax=Winogradskyella sp. 4-2091 TaxID=3381659 RepID=UPI0038918BB0
MKPIKYFVLFLIISLSFSSCTKDDLGRSENKAAISVSLKSTTDELSKVFLDIEDVQIRVDNNSSNSWVSLNAINTGTHNISDLAADTELLLVDHIEIDPSYIYEIKLVLGDTNFMDINNVIINLEVDENTIASNLVQREFEGNHIYQVILELDLDQSVQFNSEENTLILDPKLQTEIRKF